MRACDCESTLATRGPLGERRACPVCGLLCEPVAWRTVAALAVGPIPPRQSYWLCRDPECELVYFGASGVRVSLHDIRVRPGFKSGGDLLCYCFLFRRTQLAMATAIPLADRIAALVKDSGCACEVRNPSGKCCLPEVRNLARELAP